MPPPTPSDSVDYRRAGRCRPLLISLIAHAVVMVVLSLCIVPSGKPGRSLILALLPGQSDAVVPVHLQVTQTPAPAGANDSDSEMLPDGADLMIDMPVVDAPQLSINRLTSQLLGSLGKSTSPKTATEASIAAGTVASANGVAGAFATVAGAIRGELRDGDLVVAWLFDSSTSLSAKRLTLADQAEAFFEDLRAEQPVSGKSKRSPHRGELRQAVFAFGRSSIQVQSITKKIDDVLGAMRDLRFDQSGYENVMAAVHQAVRKLDRMRLTPGRAMIVILTDESGTDGQLLEQAIRACRSSDVSVHVIGPTAVFGRQSTRQVIDNGAKARVATVDKGPEAASPERFDAAFWYEDDPVASVDLSAAPTGTDPLPWPGGPFRERVRSGFGVYTLTRLAIQTGGSYTTFDLLPGGSSDGQFDPQRMRDYAPDYISREAYFSAVGQSPLRSFVVQAAQFSQGVVLDAPSVRFTIGDASTVKEFQNLMRIRPMLEKWLSRAGSLDQQSAWLADESSARWRALFQLTLGRMTALAIRIDEYLAATEPTRRSTATAGRKVICRPSPNLQLPSSRQLHAQAIRLLQRCVSQHAETPWAAMAKWELHTSMGTQASLR